MGLSISHISLKNFRNYESFTLDEIGPLTILVGPNAVGKTNVVEGIQLLTAQTSFRHPSPDELITFGASFSQATANITDGSRLLEMSMNIEEGKKRFFLNGKAKRSADLKGILPSVVFTPDDLEIAKGAMSKRRTAVDALGSQLSANHYLIKRDYEQVIKHKNRLLKEEASLPLLESINEMVVTCGAQLAAYRSALLEKLSRSMSEYYHEITKQRENLQACYIPSWQKHDPSQIATYSFGRDEARELLARALEQNLNEERMRRRSIIGPHADKIEFFIDGKNSSTYASQGQQRSIVLSFKIAEVALVQSILNQKPVLLLDDVMSELDSSRRHALISFISGDIQTFITTTTLDYFNEAILSSANIISLPYQQPSSNASEQQDVSTGEIQQGEAV